LRNVFFSPQITIGGNADQFAVLNYRLLIDAMFLEQLACTSNGIERSGCY
jgi:hypothetical protein